MSRAPQILLNGSIEDSLTNWEFTGDVTYDRTDGTLFLGCALLGVGAQLRQQFTIQQARQFTLSYQARAASSGSVLVEIEQNGTVMWSRTDSVGTQGDRWRTVTHSVGLGWGSNYRLRFTAVDVAVRLDDISLAHIYKSRSEVAEIVHANLGVIVSEASITAPRTSLEDYNDALDEGLRQIGATWHGLPDIRLVDERNIDGLIQQVELAMLRKTQKYWMTKTDYDLGPRSEKMSQINAAIDRLLGTAVGGRNAQSGRTVKTRRLVHGGY